MVGKAGSSKLLQVVPDLSGGFVPTAAVAMFCGPHDEGDQTPTRRIDYAIQIALELDVPLFVAGDSFNGDEVRLFHDRASSAGVRSVIPAFDPRHCTLSDAQAVSRQILKLEFRRLERIYLATDWWHMQRAMTMFERELELALGRRIQVVPESVLSGPAPDDLVLSNERQGLEDYLAGRYGQRLVNDPLCHRLEPSL